MIQGPYRERRQESRHSLDARRPLCRTTVSLDHLVSERNRLGDEEDHEGHDDGDDHDGDDNG